MTIVKKEVLSSNGKEKLKGIVYLPECGAENAAGYFQVVHGMCEHKGRYNFLMTEMAKLGYIVFAYDHLGHGDTALTPEAHGYIADNGGWKLLVDDVTVFYNAVKEEYGEKGKYVLFGHSMGSFIVRLAVEYGAKPDSLIVCGTGGPNPAAGAGLAMCKMVKAARGPHHVSNVIGNLAFGTYNQKFKAENDPQSWLTKDLEVREAYRNDPYCTFPFQVSAMQDLITLQSLSNKSKWFDNFPKALPVLFIAGADDPVGSYGAGVRKVVDELVKRGLKPRIKIYENCRHEILNDTCKNEVISDITEFIK